MSQPASVTFVLNVYKRPEALNMQLAAVANQTVKAQDVMIWQNGHHVEIDSRIDQSAIVARCSQNLGVWSRFSFAQNARSEYVCVLDDDTIPGTRWIENCLSAISSHEGLLGTRGMRFRSPLSYHYADEIGWRNPNAEIERVDIVGHAWFFRTEWLRAFWAEPPAMPNQRLKGEDMHFSYVMQQRLGLGTYVPKHPVEDTSFWGSLPDSGLALGMNSVAISGQPKAMDEFQEIYRAYVDRGFSLVGDRVWRDDLVAAAAAVVRSDNFERMQSSVPFLKRVRRISADLFRSEGSGENV